MRKLVTDNRFILLGEMDQERITLIQLYETKLCQIVSLILYSGLVY